MPVKWQTRRRPTIEEKIATEIEVATRATREERHAASLNSQGELMRRRALEKAEKALSRRVYDTADEPEVSPEPHAFDWYEVDEERRVVYCRCELTTWDEIIAMSKFMRFGSISGKYLGCDEAVIALLDGKVARTLMEA